MAADEIERLRADRDSWKVLAERTNERADNLTTRLKILEDALALQVNTEFGKCPT